MNSGSFFLAEISRTISSFSPGGAESASTSVKNPYLYSFWTRPSIVSVAVLMFQILSRGSSGSLARAGGATPVNGNIVTFGGEPLGEGESGGGPIDIENGLAGIAIKVAMLLHIRAKAGRAAFEGDLPHQAASHQRVEAIVNGRHGNIGHGGLGADKDLLGGGMIALVQQDVVDLLALGGEPEAPGGEAFVQGITHFFVSNRSH